MPRPRVLPGQRLRAAEACSFCREAKKRCSGSAPCTHCIRRGIGDSCIIYNRPRRYGSGWSKANADAPINGGGERTTLSQNQPSSDALEAEAEVGAGQPSAPSGDATGTSSVGEFRPISPSESRTTDPDVSTARGPQERLEGPVPAQAETQVDETEETLLSAKSFPRMLRNLRGERVYIGGGGSLSFLQLVRSIVSDKIGPSPFSRRGNSDTMLENESPLAYAHIPTPSDLDSEAKLTGGLLDVFLPGELGQLMQASDRSDLNQKALADLVLAIGLQCEPSTDTHDREMAYFREAQRQSFSGMLEDLDVDMVRVFLLMAFYLLGECRRNTAFLYLGIATRAAVGLGLHSRETYTDMSDQRQQLRLRVWMSLRVLDIVVNSLLGRPAATTGIFSDFNALIDEVLRSSHDLGLECLGASYRIVSIINTIVDRMYDRKEITKSGVEDYLRQLEHWSQGLPEFLRTPPPAGTENSFGDQSAIGRVHVSCLYYFAVTLVTRPVLVSALTQQAANASVHSQMASACLDAAMFIVQTCLGACRLKLLHANMCILKAIIFPAGLVLGFEIFAKGTVDFGIESAFQGSRELLGLLGLKSPQAALYRDILTSLSNAISEHRQRVSCKGKSSYVSKILNFDQGEAENQDAEMIGQTIIRPPSTEEQRAPPDGGFETRSFGENTPVPGDMILDWDSLDISLWDNFPYLA